jgi:ubiquinone/menaquinone biosynthesis C-methylase UbiE
MLARYSGEPKLVQRERDRDVRLPRGSDRKEITYRRQVLSLWLGGSRLRRVRILIVTPRQEVRYVMSTTSVVVPHEETGTSVLAVKSTRRQNIGKAKPGELETTDVGVSIVRHNSAGQELAASRVAQVYNRASPYYDAAPLSFWDRFGTETIDRLALPLGSTVLDVCCGMGASALPAARAVGPAGRVLAVDVAGEQIARGRDRAADAGLDNIEFLCVDATTDLPDQSFDAVICVFGIFFVADIPAFIAELWNHVRPGGQLAITTWGPDLFEPANTVFWQAVAAEDHKGFNPWDDLTTPQDVRQAMAAGGVANPHAVAVPGVHQLAEPDDFWQIVLGSGYRATIDALSSPVTDQLSRTVLDHLRARTITELITNVVHATATRPAPIGCRRLLHPLSGDHTGPAIRYRHASEFNGISQDDGRLHNGHDSANVTTPPDLGVCVWPTSWRRRDSNPQPPPCKGPAHNGL